MQQLRTRRPTFRQLERIGQSYLPPSLRPRFVRAVEAVEFVSQVDNTASAADLAFLTPIGE